jgi:hypothetical protein
MANWNEQVMRAWDEWESATPDELNDPDDFVIWALDNEKLIPRPQDIRRILRGQVTDVLRQTMRTDKNGITYRAKQCLRISEDGAQYSLWFDTDKGTTNNMRKATLQKRKAIADACFRAKCDADHFSNSHSDEDPIQLAIF